MDKRHWKTSWNRTRPRRFVLSATEEEAQQLLDMCEIAGLSVQSFLFECVQHAAKNIMTAEGRLGQLAQERSFTRERLEQTAQVRERWGKE